MPARIPIGTSTHLSGYWTNRGDPTRSAVWCNYTTPLRWDQMPQNVQLVDDHWKGRYMPSGHYIAGRTSDGLWIAYPPGHPEYISVADTRAKMDKPFQDNQFRSFRDIMADPPGQVKTQDFAADLSMPSTSSQPTPRTRTPWMPDSPFDQRPDASHFMLCVNADRMTWDQQVQENSYHHGGDQSNLY